MKDVKTKKSKPKNQTQEMKLTKNLKIIFLVVLLLLVLGISYAFFTTVLSGTKRNKITTGRLSLELINESGMDIDNDTIGLENAVPMTDEEGLELKEYCFTLRNNGTIDASYTIYLDDEELNAEEMRIDDSNIRYALTKEDSAPFIDDLTNIGENPTRDLDRGQIKVGEEINYTLRMWVTKDAGNDAMDKTLLTRLRVEGIQKMRNPNVVNVYSYNEEGSNLCITGEESTCVETRCMMNKNGCDSGTIVKYRVNNKETKYLYVLHDDGETLTLQDRENTVKIVPWSNSSSNTTGPTEALSKLENVTKDWLGVETLTYTPGVTDFTGLGTTFTTHEIKEPQGFENMSEEEIMDWMMNNYDSYIKDINNYQGSNPYTMSERRGKARMILDAEVNMLQQLDMETGNFKFPIFMYNYLAYSTSYGGTVDDAKEYSNTCGRDDLKLQGYWSMSATHGTNNLAQAMYVSSNVSFYQRYITCNMSGATGARAVISIRK